MVGAAASQSERLVSDPGKFNFLLQTSEENIVATAPQTAAAISAPPRLGGRRQAGQRTALNIVRPIKNLYSRPKAPVQRHPPEVATSEGGGAWTLSTSCSCDAPSSLLLLVLV